MKIFRLLAFALPLFVQCTPDIHEQGINLTEPVDEANTKTIAATETQASLATLVDSKPAKLDYISCQLAGGKSWVVAINSDFSAFKKGACMSPAIQAFLSKGFHVAAVNRYGYGASIPKPQDFSGPSSQQALLDLAKKLGNVEGLWGTGGGSIAVGFASKKIASVKWVMLGNTISDLEQYDASASKRYKSLIKEAMGSSDPSAFYEPRSLAWDTTGFTRRVLLYHAKTDADVPIDQSKALRDRLAAEEYQVKLEEIDGVDHDISDVKQRVIITTLLEKLSTEPAKS